MRPRRPTTITAWVVEDHEYYRASIRHILQSEPDIDCTHTFADGEAAAAAALSRHTPPDVVLMDIGLPGISGIEVTRRLRAVWPRTAVIVLTVYEQNEHIRDAIVAGATGYLLKSEPPRRVITAVRQAARGGGMMTPSVGRRVMQMMFDSNQSKGDYGLTRREGDVLRELVQGKSKKRIARELGVKFYTVDTHLRSIYRKLDVHSKSEAVSKALMERLVEDWPEDS